jgi:hypothetical protein
MVSLLVICQCNIAPNLFPALAGTFESIFSDDINDRSLLGEIVKHWLTILVEETDIDQQAVGYLYDGIVPR